MGGSSAEAAQRHLAQQFDAAKARASSEPTSRIITRSGWWATPQIARQTIWM